MKINKSNFEAYMLDYLEGNLDPLLSAELMAFLAENPELDVLPGYREEYLVRDHPMYPGKNILKKEFSDVASITAENFEEFCIAFMEGCLDENDRSRLTNYTERYPEKQKILDVYMHLKLRDDKAVVFPGKEKLKKPVTFPVLYRRFIYISAVAAAVALLVMLVARNPAQPEPAIISTLGVIQSGSEMPLETTPGESLPRPEITIPSFVREVYEKPAPDPTEATSEETRTPERGVPAPEPLHPIYVSAFVASVPPPPQRNANAVKNEVEPARKNAIEEKSSSPPAGFLGGIIKKLNVWKAAESAVSGFNYLTESQISISRQTDKTGKLTGIALDTDTYRLSGNKLK